eukprot:2779471-Amphidinium_carterae.1
MEGNALQRYQVSDLLEGLLTTLLMENMLQTSCARYERRFSHCVTGNATRGLGTLSKMSTNIRINAKWTTSQLSKTAISNSKRVRTRSHGHDLSHYLSHEYSFLFIKKLLGDWQDCSAFTLNFERSSCLPLIVAS